MSLPAATVFEIEFGGSDTNGGGFVTGSSGTDWSMQTSPQYSVPDGVTAGTTTITSATASFGTDVVGNLISVSGGTGAVVQNWYQIVSRTNATTIVVDRSTGLTAGTGVTLKIGGALATLGGLGALLTAASANATGLRAWWKYSASTYTITSSTVNVSGGLFSLANQGFLLEGYDQTRGDRTGNQPQMLWPSSGVAAPGSITYMIALAPTNTIQKISNVNMNGSGINNVGGISLLARAFAEQCTVQNFSGTVGVGILIASGSMGILACKASSCLIGFSTGMADSCWATGCTTGFTTVINKKCLATLNTNGFSPGGGSTIVLFDSCTADSNTTTGFVVGAITTIVDCIASNQSGAGGIGFNVGTNIATLKNCASYNNLTEINGTAILNEGMILSAAFTGGQPYTTAGSDFRPNATANSGALLRNTGIGVFGQTDNVDRGAVQHSDPSGGSSPLNFGIHTGGRM
jgi:hypothetical protein